MSQSYSLPEPLWPASRAAAGRSLGTRWIGGLARWLERRRQWRDLRELDDRLLADVGISPEEAWKTAGRPLHCAVTDLELATGPIQRS